MSKISIVGVEGSGKTTLMAAFGEKYERPDENGYSLDPKDERTYATICTLTGAMRNGEWPASTAHSTVNALCWTLLRRSGELVEELGDLSFLDYAGEVYRLAFGQTPTDEERAPHAAQIAALKDHVESASALAILVNLSDVINGNRRAPKVQQMVFLTGNLIKMAIQRVGAEHVALVFSQADKYHEKIESLGGLPQVLDTYLPLVATRFPKLRMFAVSAVGKTVVDEQGHENPSPDYQPTGLEDVMAWVSGCATAGNRRKPTVKDTTDASFSARWQILIGVIALVVGFVLLFSSMGWGLIVLLGGIIGVVCGCMNGQTVATVQEPSAAENAKTTRKEVDAVLSREPKPGEEMTITLPGGVPMTFCWCPATTSEAWKKISGGNDYFLMGSPTSEVARGGDEKLHRVTLTRGFWMGKYEVTQAQWKSVMGTNPAHFRSADRPVEKVTWDDCQEFILKINSVSGSVQVSLPTEAQWEYACRAGTMTPFSSGSTMTGGLYANCCGNYPHGISVCDGRFCGETTPVGCYHANSWGLHDMHGNVREWCLDWYECYGSDVTNPSGPTSGQRRVLRGGSFDDFASHCRSASRYGCGPGHRYHHVGLRLVCSAGPRK